MKYNDILVSCIMSNYNTDPAFLRLSIESILQQTHKKIEFIIVDDCSTNDSLSVIEEYASIDDRIVVVKNKKNSGLAYSLNKAISISNGKYIARMDTDDISLKNRFEVQIKYMEQHDSIGICGSFAKVFDDQNYYSMSPLYSADNVKCQLLFSATLIHPTVMFRKEIVDKYQIRYNKEYLCSQDYELWSRCSSIINISIINDVLLLYRLHANQISSKKRTMQLNYAINICKRNLDTLKITYSEKNLNCHLIISGKRTFEYDDLENVLQWAHSLLSNKYIVKEYNRVSLEKVIYNKIFNLVLKTRWSLYKKIKTILFTKKINSFYNFYTIFWRLWNCFFFSIKLKFKEVKM